MMRCHTVMRCPIKATPGRKQLPACIAALFALAAPGAGHASTWTVNSCDGELVSGDSLTKTGTLRFALANAADTDTIELAGLSGTCSKITLTTGALAAAQPGLTLHGPGYNSLTIDASSLAHGPNVQNRVLTHSGNGRLKIDSLALEGGYVNHSSGYGGCVYSAGNVRLDNALVSGCTAYDKSGSARGGAVFAKGYAIMATSFVLGSSALSSTGTAKGGGLFANTGIILSASEIAGSTAKSGGDVSGGGVYSTAALEADSSFITGNTAYSTNGDATGGGAYAKTDMTLNVALVSGNKAEPAVGHTSTGGGIRSGGNFYSVYTTISNNRVYAFGYGGGVYLKGGTHSLKNTTVSGNQARFSAGVDVFTGGGPSAALVLTNATISGNNASQSNGGLFSDAANTQFWNSTIAFNTAGSGAGVVLAANLHALDVKLYDTVISNNTGGGSEYDLATIGANTVTFNGGADEGVNLVRVTPLTTLPPTKTIKGACPRLGPLRDNGGFVQTHALTSGSAAIDIGENPLHLIRDARGPGYLRISGLSSMADLGAYEVQQNDIVFDAGFDDCPP